jgi:hypothetical protein
MKFRPFIAFISVFLLLGVSTPPQMAYASDPCDPRIEGWTYNEACGEILTVFTKHAAADRDAFSTAQVDVGLQDVRVDFHFQVVAPWGFSTIDIQCDDNPKDQTVFGLEVRGGDLSTLRSYFKADGVTLPFPIVVREFQVAGAETAFELEGHIVIPKGTMPFEGGCYQSLLGPLQYNGAPSAGDDGNSPFNVIQTTTSANSGNPQSSNLRGQQLFASPSPSSGSQGSGVSRFPEAVLGSSKMYVNGKEVPLETKNSSESELEAETDDGISIVISTRNTSSASSSNSGKSGPLTLPRGMATRVRASGFAPNSQITFWLFSTPTKLSEVTTDANGEIDLEFTLPDTIEIGDHNLQVSGEHIDGSSRDLVIGVSVVEEKISDQENSSKAEPGSQGQNKTVFWALGALLLAGLIVATVVIGRRAKVTRRIPKA